MADLAFPEGCCLLPLSDCMEEVQDAGSGLDVWIACFWELFAVVGSLDVMSAVDPRQQGRVLPLSVHVHLIKDGINHRSDVPRK